MANKIQENNKKDTKSKEKYILPKWALWGSIAFVVIVAVAVYFLAGFSSRQQAASIADSKLAPETSVEDVYTLLQQGAVVVDIRPANQWKSYHIDKSISIPLEELSGRLDELPHDSAIIVVDRGGDLSPQGRDLLLGAGFQRVTSMVGGMEEWVAQGYPFVGVAPY